MSISSSTSRVQYTLTGTGQVLSVPFYFLEDSHLKVIRTETDGTKTTLVLSTDYTVSGAGNEAGGSVTMITGVATDIITIKRSIPLTQLLDYVFNDRFPASSHEKGLDKLTMIVQQLDEVTQRSLRFEEDEDAVSVMTESGRADKVLGFDSNGNVTYYNPASVVGITSPARQYASVSALTTDTTVTAITSGQAILLRGYYADGDFGLPINLIVEASSGGANSFLLNDGRYANLYANEALKPSWFGAKAEDSSASVATANTTAINACFTAASTSASRTVLIDARYYVDGTLSCPAGVHSIIGITPRRSCIFQNTASTTTLSVTSASGNQPRLENFSVVDTNFVAETTVFTDMTHVGIDISSMSSGQLFNLYVEGFGIGISNPASYVMTYRSLRAKNCRLGFKMGTISGGSTTQLAIQCWADNCLSAFQSLSTDSTFLQCAWDFTDHCIKGCEFETEGLNGWTDLTGVFIQGSLTVIDFAYESYGLDPFELDGATTYPSDTATWAVGATANQFNLFMVSGGGHKNVLLDGVKFAGVQNTVTGDTINLLKTENAPEQARYDIENARFNYVDGNNGGEATIYLVNAAGGGVTDPHKNLIYVRNDTYGPNGTLTGTSNGGAAIGNFVVHRPFFGESKEDSGARSLETAIQNQVFNCAAGSVTLTLRPANEVRAWRKYDITQIGGGNYRSISMALDPADSWASGAREVIMGAGANCKIWSDGVNTWYTDAYVSTNVVDYNSNQADTRTGTAQAGAASTITLDASASAADDEYNGEVIEITGGTGSGQYNQITDYVGSTKVATVRNAWGVTPDATSTFRIHPANPIRYYDKLLTVDPTTEPIHFILPVAAGAIGGQEVKILKRTAAANTIYIWPQVGESSDTTIASGDAIQTMLTMIGTTIGWQWNKS